MRKLIFFLLLIVLIFPLTVFGRVGVGTGTAEIRVDKPLKPGGVYDIPSVVIFNTGDESSNYGIGIAYDADRTELRPAKEWFSFDPSLSYLEPTKSQSVAVKLTLPVKARPGDYFAYLETHPVIKTGTGTSVGMAVGTRLFFTVVPANIWQAITLRISSFWTRHAPWDWVILGIALAAIVIVFLRKRFTFQVGVRKK